jgi:putative ABC transport system permease protein
MSNIFWEISKRNIKIHKLRSALAMLGIVIGVLAIASMGILGNGMVSMVSESLSSVGDSVIVSPYTGGGGMGGPGSGMSASSGNMKLTDQNFQQIKRISAPNIAIPVYRTSDHMKIGVGGDDIVAVVYGLPSGNVPDMMKLQEGSYNSGNSGVLIGPTFAEEHHLKIGSRISVGTGGDKGILRVTGIIEKRGMRFDVSTDSALVVTDAWFENAYDRSKEYDQIVVRVADGDTVSVKEAIEKQLNRNKNEKIVTVIDSKALLETIYSTFGTVTTFVTAIGGISMVVAGVSIFNIMMMSVNERIKEIGIMRSIGTRKRGVMSMFLFEAAIIGVVGSAIGGLLSIIAGYAISSLLFKSTKYLFIASNAISVSEGVLFGIIVCLICGIYPAWIAANMNPIDALRHE